MQIIDRKNAQSRLNRLWCALKGISRPRRDRARPAPGTLSLVVFLQPGRRSV